MKDKGTDEEVTDEEWKTCAKITDEDGMKDTGKNSTILLSHPLQSLFLFLARP
jgi:hypothetical protein